MTTEGILAGHTALMVGTSPNIGAGIAIELARAGARVGCVDRDPHLAALTAKDISDGGGEAHAVGCDATDVADVTRAVSEVTDALGPVDILVNGAVVYADCRPRVQAADHSARRSRLRPDVDARGFAFAQQHSAALPNRRKDCAGPALLSQTSPA